MNLSRYIKSIIKFRSIFIFLQKKFLSHFIIFFSIFFFNIFLISNESLDFNYMHVHGDRIWFRSEGATPFIKKKSEGDTPFLLLGK